MPRYKVVVSRPVITTEQELDVDADDEGDAREYALELAQLHDEQTPDEWVVDSVELAEEVTT